MNKVILIGRLTRDPEIRYTQGERKMAVARYTLAVDRRRGKGEEPEADFIRCVSFDRAAEFAGNYFCQGSRVAVCGCIRSGSYIDRDGRTVYTTEVYVLEQEFADSPKKDKEKPAAGNEPGGNSGSEEELPQGFFAGEYPFT